METKKIGMAVFSGTGNTHYVAGLLAQELQNLGALVDLRRIDSKLFDPTVSSTTHFDPTTYDLVGIGHPILGFGATPIVLRFANALPSGSGKVFVFKSAADNHRINNAASEDLIRILVGKGYDVVHDFLYVMPCNWVFAYERRFSLQLVDRAKQKAAQHARELMTDTRSRMPVYPGWRKAARFMHYFENHYGRKQFGNSLRANSHCTQCGVCVRNCPVANIRMEGGTIHFGDECLWCMRCVYNCPARAIEALGMNWCIVKGGYRLHDYLNAPDTERTFITTESRGYWKHFWEYFD